MAKKVLSIEIGAQFIRVCEMDYKKPNPKVYQMLEFETPMGTVEDGYIRDKQGFSAALKEQLITARIRTTDVVFSINSTKIANREVVIPAVKDNKIGAMILANATEYFPVDISDYTIAHTVLERFKDADAAKIKLQVLAIPNSLVKNYYGTAKALGFHVENIDYYGNSFYQMVKKQVGSGVNVAVQINDDTTMINIIDRESLVLQRTVPYGVRQVVDTVVENATVFGKTTEKDAIEFLTKESVLNVELSIGEQQQGSMPTIASESYDRAMKERKAKEDVTLSLNYLISNITRVLDFFSSKYPDKKINYIFLCGVGGRFKNINRLFTHEIGIETKGIDSLFSVSFDKVCDLNKFASVDFIACIGAAIDPIGIFSKDGGDVEDKSVNLTGSYVFFVACLVAAVALIAISMIQLKAAQNEEDRLKTAINSKSSVREVYDVNNRVSSDLDTLRSMSATTERVTDQTIETFKQLEDHLPKSTKISSLTISESGGVSMAVTTDTKLSVAMLLMELKKIDIISNVSVASVSEQYDDNNQTTETYSVSFTMVRPPVVDTQEVSAEGEAETAAE